MATNSRDRQPPSRDRLDAAPGGVTVDYQPPHGPAVVARLAIVADSRPVATSELTTLLGRRLRFLSVLFAVLFGVVMLLAFLVGSFATGSEKAARWDNIAASTGSFPFPFWRESAMG